MSAEEPATLLRRTVTSVGWRLAAQVVSGAVLFGRSIALARLLPIELFGVFSLSASVVTVTSVLGSFGLGSALLHRCEETGDEQRAAAVHFTLTLALSSLWLALLTAVVLGFAPGEYRLPIIAIAATTFLAQLCSTPWALLVRRVQHRRLAGVTFATALVTTAVGVPLAMAGAGLWALLAIEAGVALCQVVGFYAWRPVWRPRLVNPGRELRYFLSFGLRTSLALALQRVLSRIDRLWTGIALGDTALGLYSRAAIFAGYPRELIGVPVDPVVSGSYAELKGDRSRLSGAFLDANAVQFRAAFLVGGGLVVAAPELISLLLGERWLPMLAAFQFMLVFTLLDPVKTTISSLFVGVGRPEVIVHARVLQLGVACAAIAALGWLFGIAGVAFAIGLVQLTGIAFLLRRSRAWVDISVPRLALAPSLAVGLALAVVLALERSGSLPGGEILAAFTKLVAFATVYGGALLALERQNLHRLVARALDGVRPARRGGEDAG